MVQSNNGFHWLLNLCQQFCSRLRHWAVMRMTSLLKISKNLICSAHLCWFVWTWCKTVQTWTFGLETEDTFPHVFFLEAPSPFSSSLWMFLFLSGASLACWAMGWFLSSLWLGLPLQHHLWISCCCHGELENSAQGCLPDYNYWHQSSLLGKYWRGSLGFSLCDSWPAQVSFSSHLYPWFLWSFCPVAISMNGGRESQFWVRE